MRWDKAGIPHKGWDCVSMIDAIEEFGDFQQCEMCNNERIRFIHVMEHPDFEGTINVGCICAGKMSDDYAGANLRRSESESRAKRRGKWLSRKWNTSMKGNPYLRIKGHIITIYRNKTGAYGFSIDRKFSDRTYGTLDSAKLAAFDSAWPLIKKR